MVRGPQSQERHQGPCRLPAAQEVSLGKRPAGGAQHVRPQSRPQTLSKSSWFFPACRASNQLHPSPRASSSDRRAGAMGHRQAKEQSATETVPRIQSHEHEHTRRRRPHRSSSR